MSFRTIGWRLESAMVWLLYRLFKALPVDRASAIGGWIGRVIGYHLPVTAVARSNLARALPELSEKEREAALLAMWDNLGRTAGEYPHLAEFTFGPGQRVEVEGISYFENLRDDDKGGIFFSGHVGNWELNGFCAARNGMAVHLIYRATTNPYLNWLYEIGRSNVGVRLIPKGAQGARLALEMLKEGAHLGMLVDQKMNDGIAVPFFGREAMTAPALASFALKFDCPVVPVHVVRVKGARFRLIVEPPLQFEPTGDRRADILAVMTKVNLVLERWIRAEPGQWLWLHRRWPAD